ncbi:hypothetical protein [Paenibacillus elgii]|uniref:hypothetical protein n=1 Tax=Paenibacillus elgii TaxID=189691 RepID=UPI00203D594F|nr:hypothetical protein [Paenibacillus elgii]MCM3273973.1 hypothetical protein [Paenibacillus elgii]
MDYKVLWERLKYHYEDKIERFEQKGRGDDPMAIFARTTLSVMNGLEYSEQQGKLKGWKRP